MNNPEVDILAVALTRYADACPPSLHPDCPFAIDVGRQRSCERECRDEVVRLQRPGHRPISVFSGPLFDARQLLLSESGPVPDARWHTASLVLRLDEMLSAPPRNADGRYDLRREIEVTNALAYLGQRGLDPESLLRYGFGSLLSLRIAIWVGDAYMNRSDGEDDDPSGGWIKVAEQYLDGASVDGLGAWLATAYHSGFKTHLDKWLKQAPLADVWAWSPASIDDDLVISDDDGKAAWVVDRFKSTYLSDWADTSLHREFEYLRGNIDAPIPTSEMKRRAIVMADLTSEIADRAVRSSGNRSREVLWQAVQLLGEGRRREAAALFDAARIMEPADATAHNNHGFCLTPDAPADALEALRRAEALESEVDPVNRVNQAVALRLLRRTREALTQAEVAWVSAASFTATAWLWRAPEDVEAAEVVVVNPFHYLLDLGANLAEEAGDAGAVEVWRQRAAEVSGAGE